MRILYIGDDGIHSTSYHRAKALIRLGHDVFIANPYVNIKYSFNESIKNKLHYHSGYRFLQSKIYNWSTHLLKSNFKPDLIWVNGGELLGPSSLGVLRQMNIPVLLYSNDDPTGVRDGQRFNTLKKAIPFYDLCTVVRDVNINEFLSIGAKNVLRVQMSYDEIEHKPFNSFEEIPNHLKSDIAFIGTWMPNEGRDKFLLELIKNNLPVSIWGDAWHKSKYFSELKSNLRGPAVRGREYVGCIQGAKFCLGLLSKGNRDLYTTRSLEIPFAGGLLCAERTTEHLSMYSENVEAVFWSDATECSEICANLLSDQSKVERIRQAGSARIAELKYGNENICSKILNSVFN